MQRLTRQGPVLLLWVVVSLGLSCLPGFAACDEISPGQTFQIRLLQQVSSYSAKPGMPVRGILLQSPECEGLPLFARGTEVEGRIKSVHRVGMGFLHETASLEIEFNWISPKGAPSIGMQARVVDVHAARETVKKGVIHGIRATDTPQNDVFFRVEHLLAWNPYTYLVSPVTQSVFPIVPEPEINFPPGTDLRVVLTAPLLITAGMNMAPANREFDEASQKQFEEIVQSAPQRSYNTKGKEADVVNLMFLGSRDQIESAFQTAGWNNSDPLNTRSILREFHAVFASNSYASLPMAHHLLDGMASDSSWEQSLDSYAKRDHLRIWSEPGEWQGQSIWLSASTGETGASWSFHTGKFVHHVDPNVDEERQKVVRDLSMAGCVGAVYNAPRPGMPHVMLSSSDTELRTDGAVAVVQLKDCQLPAREGEEDRGTALMGATRPRYKFERVIRTQVLSIRNIWRDNLVYDTFDLTRMGVRAIRNDHARHRESQLAVASLTSSSSAQ